MNKNIIKARILNILPEALNFPVADITHSYYDKIAEEWMSQGFISASEIWDWNLAGYHNPQEVNMLKSFGITCSVISEITTIILKVKYPDNNIVEFDIVENRNTINLNLLKVKNQNHRIGTCFMKKLCSIADLFQKDIILVPSNEFGSDCNRLIRFYEKFSFNFINNKEMKRKYKKSLLYKDNTHIDKLFM